MNQQKNDRKVIKVPKTNVLSQHGILLICVAILATVFSTVALGYQFWYQNTDKILQDAVVNSITADTVVASGTMRYKSPDINLDITLDGKSGEKGKGELSIIAKGSMNAIGAYQDFEAKGVGRILDGTLYVKLSGIKSIAEDAVGQAGGTIPPFAPALFGKIEDRWISIKASDYQDVYPTIARQQMCFSSLLKRVQTDRSLLSELAPLYKKNQIIHIAKELGSKNIEGTRSLGYEITLDEKAAASFIEGIDTTELGGVVKSCDKNVDFSTIASDLTNKLADDKNPRGLEVWVSELKHEITALSFSDVRLANGTLSITLEPVFNQTILVTKPAEPVSFKSVLAEIRHLILDYSAGRSFEDSAPVAAPITTLPSGQRT